jgi:hypothetical protein
MASSFDDNTFRGKSRRKLQNLRYRSSFGAGANRGIDEVGDQRFKRRTIAPVSVTA